MFLISVLALSFVIQLMKRYKKKREERKEKWNLNVFIILLNQSKLVFVLLYILKKYLYFCILNNIFLMNVFDFRLGSQFYRSIDEAIQENRKKGKERKENWNLNKLVKDLDHCPFVFLYLYNLNSIFLLNVFDFWLCSQFCRSIDEAIQENREERKEKWNLNVFMIALNQSIFAFVFNLSKICWNWDH